MPQSTFTTSTTQLAHSPALEIAARSIFESRALSGRVEDVVSLGALDYHWRGLFQYAAIRVGPARAEELLTQVAARSEAESLKGAVPGSARPWREHYRRMRELCTVAQRTMSCPTGSRADAFWLAPDPRYAEDLSRLRRALGLEDSELAELHFARGLRLGDAAAVMNIDEAEATRRRDRAIATVHKVFGERPPPSHDRSARGALLEAFALDPGLAPTPRRRARAPVVACGDVIAGRYQVEALIGSGAFADVYRARDRDVEGHTVALKMARNVASDEHSVHVALRELQLLASVFHPSVVQLKDHGWHDGHLWFVMPLYRGETLSQRLRRGRLSRAQAEEIFVALAEALATMHRAGVLHQDIKPENIFLAQIEPASESAEAAAGAGERNGRVLPVLLDLGLAAKDAEVVVAGTPAYLAPEVAARFAGMPDPAPVGPKADVFALALTLRDALEPEGTNEAPLANVDAFVAHRATRAPSPPRGRGLRDLNGAFARWLNLAPDARPSAAELCRELDALTAPARRAARRAATLRWVVPTAVAVFSLFGFVVYELSREAATQRVEADHAKDLAHRARERAASINADLAEQQARRRQLEADIERLENDYRESRLTREQLAERLAFAESELRVAGERVTKLQQRATTLQEELERLETERAARERELEATRREANDTARHLERLRERAEAQRAEAQAQAELRVQLEKRLGEMELALEHSRAQVADLRRATQPPPTQRIPP